MKAPVKITMLRTIRPRLTSYEMVCATARRAPIRAYLEFEAQPEPKIEYTAKLEIVKINKILRFKDASACGIERGNHRVSARIRANAGAERNMSGEEEEGRTGSLINSLMPSATG